MRQPTQFALVLFQLPDGKVVLQRRTDNARYGAGKLGIFGGGIEPGETPESCIAREIKEETNLNPESLDIRLIKDFIIPAGQDYDKDRHFFLYSALVPNADFEVYEGKGAEDFTIADLSSREDLTGSAKYVVRHVL